MPAPTAKTSQRGSSSRRWRASASTEKRRGRPRPNVPVNRHGGAGGGDGAAGASAGVAASARGGGPAGGVGTLADLNQNEAAQGADELSTQAQKIWRAYDPAKASDADVKKAVEGIEGVIARAGVPVQVRLSALTKEDLALVGITRDPGTAQG